MFNRKSSVRSLFFLALLLALLATGCSALAPAAQEPIQESGLSDIITVTGTGLASGSPDIATVILGVNVLDDDAGDAVTGANQIMEAVTQSLSELGIAEQDIQTKYFNVWPEERYNPETGLPSGERSYRVESSLQVRVREINLLGEVIGTAMDAGANNVSSLTFGLEDPAALLNEARSAAVDDAQDKAAQLADLLGVELGEPVMIGEASSSNGLPVPYGVEAAVGIGGGAPPISQGETSVNVSVSVTYRIEN